MNTQLETILAETRQSVKVRKSRSSRAALERAATGHSPRGFAHVLRQRASVGPAVIAELKKASPSRGLIREDFDVRSLAADLARSGAAALSVLTDEPFFQGSLQNLEQASEASGLPCLRKDFMIDEFQIVEARAHRADAILLIAAALSDQEMSKLAAEAHGLQLDVLCEVHTREELDRVLGLDLQCDAIGVNNRNLKSFEVRLEASLDLAARLPAAAVHVAESGIQTGEDINLLRNAGYHAFLIGESLMRQPDPGQALAGLLAAAQQPIADAPGAAAAARK
jgi:indole-3-glycerol phosphate synthase